MYILYKVNVWIRAEIDANTPINKILENIDNIPSGRVDFIEIEDYLTKTEEFILPTNEEATLKIYSNQDHLIFSNQLISKDDTK